MLLGHAQSALAQTLSHRGFVEGTAFVFPQDTPNDPTQLVGDLLAREEVTVRPARWFLFAAGVDFRANSHDQVDDSWRLDFSDRGRQRPRLSTRRLVATLTRGPLTLDLGKQFVRWGKTDIIVPTDRFAPRDFLTVIDAPYLAITAARAHGAVRQPHGRGRVGAAVHAQPHPAAGAALDCPPRERPCIGVDRRDTAIVPGGLTGRDPLGTNPRPRSNIPSPSMTGSTICRTFEPARLDADAGRD